MISTSELSKKLHLHPDSVRRLRREGKLKGIRKFLKEGRLYQICEIAQFLDLSPKTIHSMISNQKILTVKIGGRRYIPKDEAIKIQQIRN